MQIATFPSLLDSTLENSSPDNNDITAVMDPPPRAASVLSMDDLEAAQALEGLRSGMYLP